MAIKIKIKKEHKTILRRLYYDRIIDSRYTPIEELCKGVSCHTKGSMAEAANDLLKAEYLIPKRARYGLPVLLNPLKINEVKRILEEVYRTSFLINKRSASRVYKGSLIS